MKTHVALLIPVWGLAFASAAFAYAVHRPVQPAASQQAAGGPRPSPSWSPPTVAEETSLESDESALQFPETVIVVSRPRATFAPAPRDLSEMRCGDWQPLVQGSAVAGVRYCD